MAKITSRPVSLIKHHGALTRLCFYALAFSTLLSSQGTDAHHGPALAVLPGKPFDFTRSAPSCQARPGYFRFVLAFGDLPDVFDYTRDSPATRIGRFPESLRAV